MDLYTLDSNFLRQDVVDGYQSVIWTERYSSAGDVNLVLPLTKENIAKIPEGIFLGTPDSDEVMILESVLKDSPNGVLKCTGPTLTKFLDQRVIRTSAAHEDQNWNIAVSDGFSPAAIMAAIVREFTMDSTYLHDDTYRLDGPHEVIPNLSMGPIDPTGDPIGYAVPFGPVYAPLLDLASSYSLGFKLYLESADVDGYDLKFAVYQGRDLTTDQLIFDPVQFSPSLDSLANTTELRSIANYKTVCYAFAPSNPGGLATTAGVAYAHSSDIFATGFNRRTLMIFATDLSTDTFSGDAMALQNALDQRAKDALANNNYTKVVDGEVVPQSQYKYKEDYRLGDIIELTDMSDVTSHARVTEYIRSKDATGEKAYPTISLIDTSVITG